MRKFYAATVEDALAQVARELGEDAVILDTRTVQERDNHPFEGVEVWVQEPETAPVPAPALKPPPMPVATTPDALAGELHHLQAQIQTVHQQLDSVVQRMGWLGATAGEAVGELGDAVASSLALRLPFSGGIRLNGSTRVALIGPAGVGKTTQALKLAYHLAHGCGVTVGLIAADTLRVGAREQIGKACAALGLPLAYVYNAEQVAAAVDALRDCQVLLLDTPGVNPRQADECAWLDVLLTALDPAEVHLVLPAALTGTGLRALLRAYARYEPDHLILTKLDEIACLSESAPLILDSGLALSFLGIGPSIMDDLLVASAEECARFLRAE